MEGEEDKPNYHDTEFGYWILFVLIVVLIPSTWWAIRKLLPKKVQKHIDCSCEGCTRKQNLREKEIKSSLHSISTYIKFAAIIIMWLAFFYVLNQVSNAGVTEHEPYNPFTVLNLADGASDEEVKRAYRKLSLQYHPDKSPGKESQEKFIAISKAYEALTDPAIREKLEKYGNPDGPQPIKVGIALPSWLINRNNSGFVLTAYLILLVILVPTGVYFWNKRQRSKNPGLNVAQNTLGLYYHMMDEKMKMRQLIEIIGASSEYKDEYVERVTDIEDLKTLMNKLVPADYRIKKMRFNQPYIIKATFLIYAHISRLHGQLSPTLETDLEKIIARVRALVNGGFQLCKERHQMLPLTELIKLSQCITQAAWEDQSLRQIPHLDASIIHQLSQKKITDVAKFKRMGKEKRLEFFNGSSSPTSSSSIPSSSSLTAAQINDIESVTAKIPAEVGISYKLNSDSDNGTFYTSSICNLEVEFIDTTPTGTTKKPVSPIVNGASTTTTLKKRSSSKKSSTKNKKEDNNDIDSVLRDLGEEPEKSSTKKKEKKTDLKPPGDDSDSDSDFDSDYESDSDSDSDWDAPPKTNRFGIDKKSYCHSPYDNEDRALTWWIAFGTKADGYLAAMARSETHAPGTTVKLTFVAPLDSGKHTFSLHLLCDGYVGCDSQVDVVINVVPNPAPNEQIVQMQRNFFKQQAQFKQQIAQNQQQQQQQQKQQQLEQQQQQGQAQQPEKALNRKEKRNKAKETK